MKFKLKKIRITRNEKALILGLLIVIFSLPLFFFNKQNNELLNSNVQTDKDKMTPPVKIDDKPKVISFEEIVQKTVVPGEKKSIIFLGNRYVIFNYFQDNLNNCLIIDNTTGNQVELNSLIKSDSYTAFDEKINDLIRLKFPKDIASKIISDAQKSYTFYDDYMLIYFTNAPFMENSKRNYDLKVYYNEIKDYLSFNMKVILDYENENGFSYDPSKVTFALTFDDGPAGAKTISLIDKLEDYKSSATFFMVANKLESYPDAVKKVANSHSEIGYHSFAHQNFTKQKTEEINSEFNEANSILNGICGKNFLLTRPPYGSYNESVLNSIESSFIRWNVDTEDWRYKDSDYVYKYVIENYHDGDIMLLHDIHETSVEAALKFIEYLYLQDVQVVSVSTLASIKGQSLNNHEVYFSIK